MSKTLIHNIGTILSGDFENPILAGDTVCTDGDKIVFIGNRADAPALDYTLDIDANGLTLCPGIIDAHAHPPLANYLEAYKAYDWVDNYAGAASRVLSASAGITLPVPPGTSSPPRRRPSIPSTTGITTTPPSPRSTPER